jgi:DNA invertase Pin-like site-specific DNA recombinase
MSDIGTILTGAPANTTETELIAMMRQGMVENKRQIEEKEKTRKRKRTIHAPPDPLLWEALLLELIEAKPEGGIVIGFWRVSSIGQEENGYSSDTQKQGIIAWVVTNIKRATVDIWVNDVFSGAEEDRPGLNFLRRAMESGAISHIVFFKHCRLCRGQLLAESLQRESRKHGTKLISATENIPQGPGGALYRQVIQAFGQFERALIKERMKQGRHHGSTENGLYSGLYAPYGYETVNGKLVLNPAEAAVIRTIHFLHSKGYSHTAIGHWLHDNGVPMRHDNRRGWDASAIQRALGRESQYRGEAIFGTVFKDAAIHVCHEPILPYREPSERTSVAVKKLPNGSRVPQNFLSDDPIMPRGLRGRPEKANGILLAFHFRESSMTYNEIANRLNDLGETTQLQRKWTPVSVGKYLEKKEMWIAAAAAVGVTAAIMPASPGEADAEATEGVEKND